MLPLLLLKLTLPVLFLLLIPIALVIPSVVGDPFNQIFITTCGPIPTAPPVFKRWSNPQTWKTLNTVNPTLPAGVIPGVGAGAGVNVTIPCGSAILLDVLQINITLLDIKGILQVEDPATPKAYSVSVCWVIVEGQLLIGSRAKQFASKIAFTLMPNPNGRLNLTWVATAYPNQTYSVPQPSGANIGHKAFAVVGGQAHMHGMPGGISSPAWVKLNATLSPGSNNLTVDRDASGWPIGGQIVVSSSDYDPYQDELAVIVKVSKSASGGSIITVDRPFNNTHYGDAFGIPDGFGGFVDERAEVALLSRNILIQGLDEPTPNALEGGHFIIHMTRTPQYIEGVEFYGMGQQGRLGRYSVHFHACGDTGNTSVLYKNAIHYSKQRCIVVHATHNLTVDSNVAYDTAGHCFMTEEGSEMDNTFVNNLGMRTTGVSLLIYKNISGIWMTDETDNQPSTFWITNLQNSFIRNTAAGCSNAGMWVELRPRVRGMSLERPELVNLSPQTSSGGTFDSNTIHSNGAIGLQGYPHGIRPAPSTPGLKADQIYKETDPTALFNMWDGVNIGFVISRLNIYKHKNIGMFTQATNGLLIVNSTFADNLYGLFIQSDYQGLIVGCRFIGLSNNLGSLPPVSSCGGLYGAWVCAPISGCLQPTSQGNVRSMGWSNWLQPTFGIVLVGVGYGADNSNGLRIARSQFSGFNATCRPAAAISPAYPMGGEWWDAAVGFQSIKTAPGTLPVWFPTPSVTIPGFVTAWRTSGWTLTDLVIRDKDGSALGGSGGYFVANDPFLLPPNKTSCTPVAGGNNFACPGTCYRSVKIKYVETGLTCAKDLQHGDTSYITLVRDSDNMTRATDGNLGVGNAAPSGCWRWYYLNLLAGQTYSVYISPPTDTPDFYPTVLTIHYVDGWDGQKPCPGSIGLRIMPNTGSVPIQWLPVPSSIMYTSPCPGLALPGSTIWPVYYRSSCFNQISIPTLNLTASLPSWTAIYLFANALLPQSCNSTSQNMSVCGVIPNGDLWAYNVSGAELHTQGTSLGFQSPSFNQNSWSTGRGIIGNVNSRDAPGPWITTKTGPSGTNLGISRTTFYFRKSFNVSSISCYSGIVIEYLQVAGIAIYLNGVEAFRYNLPSGTLLTNTTATSPSKYTSPEVYVATPVIPLGSSTINSASFPFLTRGVNVLAVETHVFNRTCYSMYFDARISLVSVC